jgi:hypothetical protein
LSLHGPHIDPQIERQFQDFNPEPPEGAWNRIAASLDQQKRRRSILWWGSSAAAFLLVGSLMLMFRNTPETRTPKQAEVTQTEPSKDLNTKGAADLMKAAPEHPETPIRTAESLPYYPLKQKPALPTIVQNNAVFPAEAATHSIPLPQGFGISGKGIDMLPVPEFVPGQSTIVSFAIKRSHRARVSAPAVEIGLVLNPSFQQMNLRLAAAWIDYVHEDYLGIRRNQETPLEALQGGVDLALRLGSGWRFNSGLWFTEHGSRQAYNYAINKLPAYRGGTSDLFGNRLIEGYFIDPTPESVRYNGTTRMQMLQIPLQAGYEHRIGLRGGLLIQAGAAASLLFSSEGMNINYSNLQLSAFNNKQFRQTQWAVLGNVTYMQNLNRFLRAGLGIRREQSIANQYKSGAPLIGKGGNTGVQLNLHYRIY